MVCNLKLLIFLTLWSKRGALTPAPDLLTTGLIHPSLWPLLTRDLFPTTKGLYVKHSCHLGEEPDVINSISVVAQIKLLLYSTVHHVDVKFIIANLTNINCKTKRKKMKRLLVSMVWFSEKV